MASAMEQDTKALKVAFDQNLPFHKDAFRSEKGREPTDRELRQIRRDCLNAVHDTMVYIGDRPEAVLKAIKKTEMV